MVLQQAPVSSLAVARVETVLEHGGLYVVAPSLLLRRQALNLTRSKTSSFISYAAPE